MFLPLLALDQIIKKIAPVFFFVSHANTKFDLTQREIVLK